MRRLASLSAFVLLTGGLSACTTPGGFTDREMAKHDNNTSFQIEENDQGFVVNVYYSRYQFIPETDAVIAAAKSAAMSIAYETAEQRGRSIQSINEQRIKVSTGRNGLTGITSCTVQAPAQYK